MDDDPHGTYLPDAAAALSYAEYTIRELRKKSGWNDPALMMFVEDQARKTCFVLAVFTLDEARRIAANVAGIWLILGRGRIRSCLV